MASLIQETMGGTSGAIYAIFFNAVSNSLGKSAARAGSSQQDVTHSILVAEALQQGLSELCRYTSARVGSRTIMDALIPFVETLHEKPGDLRAAVAAASAGAEKTRRMEAKLGRASYVAKEQLSLEEDGIPDPGALGVVSVLEGVMAGLAG
jgi:dihydroxyacetone kinase